MNKVLPIFVFIISVFIVHGIWSSQDKRMVCQGGFYGETAPQPEKLIFKAEIYPWWFTQKDDKGQVRVQYEDGRFEYLDKLKISSKSGDWIFELSLMASNKQTDGIQNKGVYYGLAKTVEYYDSIGRRFDGECVEQ